MNNYIDYDSQNEDVDTFNSTPPLFFNGRDWNKEFQELMETHYNDPQKELQRMQSLRELADSFAQRAEQIGKIIIDELYLPFEAKKVKPVTGDVGGIAGGEKYIEDGIFFKFALDNKGVYGGDEYALKSGGHEFLSFLELMNCRVQGLHFPFIVIVDYLGYRLVALSSLPIQNHTLIYGSSDGGRNIYQDDKEFNVRIKKVAKILNLTGHHIWNNQGTSRYKLYTAIDCEGHRGEDGRLYVIDPARLFPPAYHQKTVKGSKLYRLMRPELVKMSTKRLCSDAFTSFKVENIKEHEQNIIEVYETLHRTIIPQFANYLEVELSKRAIDIKCTRDMVYVMTEMHLKGINIRYLSYVLKYIQLEPIRKLICTIIIGRTIKNLMRNHMRALKTSEERAHKSLVVAYFNLTFNSGAKSEEYWNVRLLNHIEKSFPEFQSAMAKTDLKSCIYPLLLYMYIQDKLGIETSFSPHVKLDDSGNLIHKLTEKDITTIKPKIKYTNRLSFEEGTAMSRMAVYRSDEASDKYFQMAEIKYKAALQIKPNDPRTLHNWGISLVLQARKKNEEHANILYNLAETKWMEAIKLNSKDDRAYLYWGNMFVSRFYQTKDSVKKVEYLQLATEKYKEGHKVNVNNYAILRNWATSLITLGSFSGNPYALYIESVKRLEEASKIKQNSFKIKHSLSIAIAKLARSQFEFGNQDRQSIDESFEMAYKAFDECLAIRPNHCEVNFNYGNTCLRHAKILEEMDKEKCFLLCALSTEKYLNALNFKLSFLDALYNWSNAILVQLRLELNPSETMFSLNCFLEIYKKVSSKFGPNVLLDPFSSLMNSKNVEVKKKAFSTLVFIGNRTQDQVLRKRAMDLINSVSQDPFFAEIIESRTFKTSNALSNEINSIIYSVGYGDQLAFDPDNLQLSSFNNMTSFKEDADHHTVHISALKSTQQPFIILEIERDHILDHLIEVSSCNLKESMKSIIHVLKSAHPFIATVSYSFQTDEGTFCLAYASSFSHRHLSSVFQDDSLKLNVKDEALRLYCAELVLALKYLHENDLVYKQLSPDSIWLDDDGHLYLHKFPYSSRSLVDEDEDDHDLLSVSVSLDWKLMGLCVYQLLTGDQVPYHTDFGFIKDMIVSLEQELLSDNLREFICTLLSSTEDEESNIERIMNHKYFLQLNWEDIFLKKMDPPYKPKLHQVLTQIPTYISDTNLNKFRGFSFVEP